MMNAPLAQRACNSQPELPLDDDDDEGDYGGSSIESRSLHDDMDALDAAAADTVVVLDDDEEEDGHADTSDSSLPPPPPPLTLSTFNASEYVSATIGYVDDSTTSSELGDAAGRTRVTGGPGTRIHWTDF
jgi:hypothetical protein